MSSVRASHPTPRETVVPFTASDGFACNLLHIEGGSGERGPVLLVHGAGVRANIFRAPVQTTIVDRLVEHGYDVWLENWRASIDLPPSTWTLDQAAVFDHPQAVRTVLRETGMPTLKALIHCQGSTSFMMSAAAGLLPQVSTIVTNAVSLHPVVTPFSRLKLKATVPLVSAMMDYLNPQWGLDAPTLRARLIALVVMLTHHECDNLVCRQVSFTYGSGFPTLWSHENLNDETHEWLKREFAHVPLSFFRQITKSVSEGALVTVDGRAELPANLGAQPPRTDARIAFIAGERNVCFLPESQRKTFEFFSRHSKQRHTLHIVPNYGHLDMFMGRNAARDVFPIIIGELDQT